MTRTQLLSTLLVGLLSTSAAADIPLNSDSPKERPAGKKTIPVAVHFDTHADWSHLEIGREALDIAPSEKQSRWSPSSTRSIVAAAALSLGIAGVVLLRGRRPAQMACFLVLAAALGAVGNETWANVAPHRYTFPDDAKVETGIVWNLDVNGRKVFLCDAVVEVIDGHDIRLVVGTKPFTPPVEPANVLIFGGGGEYRLRTAEGIEKNVTEKQAPRDDSKP
jgi:hypothetical protein